jgi:uncharacterized protein
MQYSPCLPNRITSLLDSSSCMRYAFIHEMRSNMANFLKKKNISLSFKVYFIDALSAMALGLFSTLIIGLIVRTLGDQSSIWFGENVISTHLVTLGQTAMGLMGAGIGVAVAHRLQAPPLVLFSSAVTGMMGATLGGPAGSFVAAVIATEFGKLVSKETQLDILVTPFITLLVGSLVALSISPIIAQLMTSLGAIIIEATTYQPFFMGIIVSMIMGLVLTAPISSAALGIMLNLSGLAAGAATVGCAAHMIGFAVMGLKDNKPSSFISVGLGTSMLHISNIVKNPWILVPPILTSIILGPLSTMLFSMSNIAAGSGMGTSGLVGQITTLNTMGWSQEVLFSVGLLHFILPAVLTFVFYKVLVIKGKIKPLDLKLDV